MPQSTPEYTRELVEFLSGLEDVPAEVLDRARYFLLDYLGVALRGSQAESSAPVRAMIERLGGAGSATVIGTPMRATPALAALANGASAHAIEMDDTHSGGSIHLGATIYSAALAVAEMQPEIDARKFFTAAVAGYEAAARIAMAFQPQEHYALGFHPTATCGVFGATVTAARLLGLSTEQMLQAAGIAGSMSAGSMEFLAEGAWTKRLHPGLAAQNGIQAAILAGEGFRGPRRILEGRDGLLWAYSKRPVPQALTEDLGDDFEILHTSVKPHACCRYMQGPIDAILEMVRKNDIHPDDVREIQVAVLQAGWGIVAEPRERKYHPESVVDAQFSIPFGAAIAVVDRAAGLDQFTLEKIESPAVRSLIGRVTLLKDARIEQNFPREWPAYATIALNDGRIFEEVVRYPKGDPENPLTWDEMRAKFEALTAPVLPEERRRDIVEQISASRPAVLAALCEAGPVPTARAQV